MYEGENIPITEQIQEWKCMKELHTANRDKIEINILSFYLYYLIYLAQRITQMGLQKASVKLS